MPDIFDNFNQHLTKEAPQPEATAPQEHQDFIDYPTSREEAQQAIEPEKPKGLGMPDNYSGDPNEQMQNENTQYSNQQLGAISTQNTRDLQEDPDSWSPEFTMRPWLEESGTSIARGFGNHILKGTGDMFQVAGSYAGFDISKGNMISRALQETGADLAADYKSHIPEELLHENLDWKSMADPKFWSTHVAEMIPQLAEFILISKGGASAAKSLLGKAAQKAVKKGVITNHAKTALGKEVFGTGKGLAGKMITEQGLSGAGNMLAGAVGGGITGNLMSGMLNAAQVVNDHKELKDADGNLVFDEEQLSQMASGTMRNNASWMLLDMASWGMTYGGGWKALKGLNPVAKGGKMHTAAQQSKIASKMFQYDIAPIAKSLTRLAGKAGMEGLEETFQETWEEWAAKKAVSDVTGEPLEYKNYLDFYNSKENKGTKVLSFAVGALGGAAFNVTDLINKKADESAKLHNRIQNFKQIVDKNGTNEELDWQEYHIRQQIADIVIDDKLDLYEDFSKKLVKNGNITEDEKERYDQMVLDFKEVKSKAKRLNVKGLSALMYNNAKQTYFDTKIAEYEELAKEQIDTYKSLQNIDEGARASKIRQTEGVFQKRLKALSILRAEAIQNQENLIIGRKANPLEVDLVLDEYGNEMVIGGLSSQQLNEYTKEGDAKSKGEKALDSAKGMVGEATQKAKGFKMPSMANLSQKSKEMVNKVMDQFKTPEEKKAGEEILEKDEATPGASGETTVDGKKVKTPKTEEQAKKEAAEVNEAVEIDPNETVSDDVYNAFKEKNEIPMSTIQDIAKAIRSKGKLTGRQDEMRATNKEAVLREITKQILKTSQDAPAADPKGPENEGQKTPNPEPKEPNTEGKDTNPEPAEDDNNDDDTPVEVNDESLTPAEKAFVQGVAKAKSIGKSIADVTKKKVARAKKVWDISRKNIDNSESSVSGMDNRSESSTVVRNRTMARWMDDFINKLRMPKSTEATHISQNDLDNYLNQYSSYNMYGPQELDKMVVVNHQLKRMFPNAEKPTEVFIVRNMFQSLGADAVGHALAGTIFIDSKNWNQDRIFMHELSHIYYQLSKNEPETQANVKSALANPELVADIKKRYKDLTLYEIQLPNGKTAKYKEKDIFASYLIDGADKNNLEEYLKQDIAAGILKTVPMSQQSLLIEEMFVKRLEGPLADEFDKIFKPKNEPQRQKDTRIWWGLLRKKGEIIEKDGGVDKMLRQLNKDGVPSGNMKDFILDTFKAVTKGVDLSAEGMDARANDMSDEQIAQLEDIASRKKAAASNIIGDFSDVSEEDIITDIEDTIEDSGESFYAKDFDDKAKGATKILKRFGIVYNKAMRTRHLAKNKGRSVDYAKTALFNRDLFESIMYNLAIENPNSNEFIRQIENSKLREVKAFNDYMTSVHGDNKLNLLNSMHLVFSNSKHIVAFKNTITNDGKYEFVNSLSQVEIHRANKVLSELRKDFDGKSDRWKNFEDAVNNIYSGNDTKADYLEVINTLAPPFGQFNLEKVLEQGYITYQGVNVPIETLISGFIKKGMLFQKIVTKADFKKAQFAYNNQVAKIPAVATNKLFHWNGVNVPTQYLQKGDGYSFNEFKNLPFPGDPAKGIYLYNARPLVESFINTNRKFSPLSSVRNAEGNMTPVRITNNHLTKEVDNMINFLSPDENGKIPTKEQFFERFSHLAEKNKKRAGRGYVPNIFLNNIYENAQVGIMPTISQYNGIENISNKTGNLYAGSTALEQGIEDFLIFTNTSRNARGVKNRSYLGNLGAFSDSPRKFLMNMPRIKFEDVFEYDDAGKIKYVNKREGNVVSSAQHLHDEIFWDDEIAGSRQKFKDSLRQSVIKEIQFMNSNGAEMAKIDKLKNYFNEKNRLNPDGIELVAEYVVNSTVNGYNTTEVFLPGITGKDIVKRFKMNSSPIISVKNPNFKIEPLFFADELLDGSIAGTDSGMYILEEDAQKLQQLGKGVFNMNHGFKLLNASIEKENPNFKGKTAYLKGYTTIVKKGHPLFEAMNQRKLKYLQYHGEKFGVKPSQDLSDGSFNHMVIAIPQSSDKSNFSGEEYIQKGEYTEAGMKRTPAYLRDNPISITEEQDKLFYKNGEFVGIESYNFGPQQLMDKKTSTANTPVQMINSIIVNATLNGELDLANEIQQHISNQKRENLQKVLDKIKDHSITEYRALIMEGLNKEDMNQAQRILLDDNGSLAHPYVNEIVVNQLAQTLRRMGNKLSTPGTLAHQKPDIGFEMAGGKVDQRLQHYQPNGDGSLAPAEIILPKHMSDKVQPRQSLTYYNFGGKSAIENSMKGLSKEEKAAQTLTDDLNAIQFAALDMAEKRHGVSRKEAFKYIAKEYDSKGVHIGFHVKGHTVIASRVPGHGPASTGVFEVLGFDTTEGNQVMVPSAFSEVIGADNDGDALFIQTKGGKKFGEWNQAFDKMTKYWLSPKMKEQINAKMVFVDETREIVKEINGKFPKNKEYITPFSPEQRRKDYNNTMISKRNVGPVFNTHKLANLLAAYEIAIEKPITIGGTTYDRFKDYAQGNGSRNQQSAILANIILDNSKHGFADDIGLDEHNISQAILLVNMGIPLVDVGMILNSPAAKLWSELNRNNNSAFHSKKKRETIVKEIYAKLKVSRDSNIELKVNPKNADKPSEQAAIIEMFGYLSDMNAEVQKISKIMTGHKTIHVNPLVLEQQLADFSTVLNNKSENQILKIDDKLKNNADLKNYQMVAEETLEHTKRLNPVYATATNKVLSRLKIKMGDIGVNEIESISRDFLKFRTSRLLGFNNISKEYAKDLMNPFSETSIYKKLNNYLQPLKSDIKIDEENILNSVSKLHNSILFRKALNISLDGNEQYISANTSFVNESFNEVERERAQQEFEELPVEIQKDLMLYDLIQHGWKGPQSMAPFFGKDENFMINMYADEALKNPNTTISEVVLKNLEQIIALKHSQNPSNSFQKIYLGKNDKLESVGNVVNKIFEQKDGKYVNEAVIQRLQKPGGMYLSVWSDGKPALFEVADMAEFLPQILSERTASSRKIRLIQLAKENITLVPNALSYDKGKKRYNADIDLALIEDKNIPGSWTPSPNYDTRENMDSLTEATISYEEASARMRERLANQPVSVEGMDAKEEFDLPMFEKEELLTPGEFDEAMEYNPLTDKSIKEKNYANYVKDKKAANELAKTLIPTLDSKTADELLDLYSTYGEKDVYAYSIVMTPIIKKLAGHLASDQAKLWKDNEVEGKGYDGQDISKFQAYMISGSTIPSNHPAAQSLARMLEKEYKTFINEKSKYMREMNKITDALYKEKLGYGSKRTFMGTIRRIRDMFTIGQSEIYDRLYGNLVTREEVLDKQGNLTYNFKLRPQDEMEREFKAGYISATEKDFYDFFRKTTNELMPPKAAKKRKEDYIPHTAMSKLEAFSARGLLGLMVNSRGDDEAIYDVKMNYKDPRSGETKLMNFKHIEDIFKRDSADVHRKNDINRIMEYRKMKKKALQLLKTGKNEDGSKIIHGTVGMETALGFGAINRFVNNRSVKATELPTMDLNKALGDYIHSTLFVNGNKNFKGMEKLQGYIDGVLAFNRENNLPNMNIHVQKVWKDYFTKGERQESALGKDGDKILNALTRFNLFYALGYQANKNTYGLYSIGNILVGKYHNIKDLGGKKWIEGEKRFWGLDKGLEGGLNGVLARKRRMAGIMKSLNFMEINVYDEVNMEKKNGLDAVFSDLALSPMIYSEKWIQQVHMIGLLTEEELNKFDENGNYHEGEWPIDNHRLIELEDKVKASHGRGYQPTDQRVAQMYSWGNMMLQFSKFLPTMVHDRFSKEDINIYGKQHIGSLRSVGKMVRHVMNDPQGFVEYRKSLSPDQRARLDSGLKGMAMTTIIGLAGASLASDTANDLFWDSNYYMNLEKLENKMVAPAIQTTNNLLGSIF